MQAFDRLGRMPFGCHDTHSVVRVAARADFFGKIKDFRFTEFLLTPTPNHWLLIRSFHPKRGRIAIATKRWMESDGCGCVAWRAAHMRTAKACGPDPKWQVLSPE
jgi:hypothetical protein